MVVGGCMASKIMFRVVGGSWTLWAQNKHLWGSFYRRRMLHHLTMWNILHAGQPSSHHLWIGGPHENKQANWVPLICSFRVPLPPKNKCSGWVEEAHSTAIDPLTQDHAIVHQSKELLLVDPFKNIHPCMELFLIIQNLSGLSSIQLNREATY